MRFLILFIVIWILLHFTACNTVTPTPEKNVFYKRDLTIKFQGKKYKGTAVLPLREVYRMEVRSTGNMDYFIYKTCHRQIELEKLRKSHEFEFKLTLENQRGVICPMEIEAYENDKHRHGFAFIAFKDNFHKLKAKINCNGETSESHGLSICQAKEGLLQKVSFLNPMKMSVMKSCDTNITKSKNYFQYKMPKGICVFEIKDLVSNEFHRHFSVGYEKGLIRK